MKKEKKKRPFYKHLSSRAKHSGSGEVQEFTEAEVQMVQAIQGQNTISTGKQLQNLFTPVVRLHICSGAKEKQPFQGKKSFVKTVHFLSFNHF